MSVNRLKKIIIKKNVPKENKYVGNDEPNKKTQISETYNYTINNQKTKNGENQEKNNESLTENIIETNKNINELNNELNYLKNEYESEKIKTVENLQIINNKLSETNKKFKLTSNQNYQLILKLKNIESQLKTDYLKSFNERMKKRNLYLQNEQTLKNRIVVKEEEIKIEQKFALAEKKQQRRYENLLNEVNNGMEENINNDLKELKEELTQLNGEIQELYQIKLMHKTCPKIIQNLKNRLSLFNTEYEFESKKNGMLINQSYNNKINISPNDKTNFSEEKEISPRNLKINYSQNIRKIILKQNIPKPEKLNISTSRYITEKINLINKTPNKKLIYDAANTNKNKNENVNLFKESEYNFLKKIIPSKYMNRYINEFDNIKKEKEGIQKSFEKNNDTKDNNGKMQFKIDYIEVKKKEENKKYIELLLKFRNNEKKKKDLQAKIKMYEKELKKYNKKIDVIEKMKRVFMRYEGEN